MDMRVTISRRNQSNSGWISNVAYHAIGEIFRRTDTDVDLEDYHGKMSLRGLPIGVTHLQSAEREMLLFVFPRYGNRSRQKVNRRDKRKKPNGRAT